MALGPGWRRGALKNPGGHDGGRGHQNMTTGSTLGPATHVRILAPIGANAFDSIAGQTEGQRGGRDQDHFLNYSIDIHYIMMF